MSRSTGSNAINEDPVIASSEVEEQNKEEQPSAVSMNQESVEKGETSENLENIGVKIGDSVIDATEENIGNSEAVTQENENTQRPKRTCKPSAKSIENRIQSDKTKLEKLWEKVMKSVSQLHDAPNSVNVISEAISQVRSNFNIYQETWLLFADFLAYAGTPQCLEECQRLESIMSNHKQFVHENIAQGNQRKEEILLEMRSIRSGSVSRASSMSSAALRAKARAKAAEAMKRAELQKKRLVAESQSALQLQQEELALAKHKLDEQARLEALRLEEEVAIAVAKANAIDDELGHGDSDPLSHLNIPEENPSQRVQSYIENQCTDPPHDMNATPLSTNDVHNPSTEHVMPQPQHVHPVQDAPTLQPLNPTVNTFTPSSHLTAPSKSDQNTMRSCIEFMARRELIAKKIEKFDNIPENYHTWKLAFKNMISGINITPSEELSLLIEYTTNESK